MICLASETDRYGSRLQFVYDLSGNRLGRSNTAVAQASGTKNIKRRNIVIPHEAGEPFVGQR